MMPTFIPVGVAGGGMQLSMGLSMSGEAAGLMVPFLVRLAGRLFGTTDEGRANDLLQLVLRDPALRAAILGAVGPGGLTEDALQKIVLKLMDNPEIQKRIKEIAGAKVMQRSPATNPNLKELERLRGEIRQLAKELKEGRPQATPAAAPARVDPREELRHLAKELREGRPSATTPAPKAAAPKVQADPRAELKKMLAELKAEKKPTTTASAAGSR